MQDIKQEDAAWIASYEEGLSRYRGRDFLGAITLFEAVLRAHPHDRPASLLLEHSRHLEQSGAGREWQAISILKTK
jgi:adenylate cyclase